MSHHNYMFLAHCAIESIVRSSVQRCVPSNAITLSTNDCYETLMQICSVLHFLLTRKKIIIINNRTSRKEHECIYKIAFIFGVQLVSIIMSLKMIKYQIIRVFFHLNISQIANQFRLGSVQKFLHSYMTLEFLELLEFIFCGRKCRRCFNKVGNRGNPS